MKKKTVAHQEEQMKSTHDWLLSAPLEYVHTWSHQFHDDDCYIFGFITTENRQLILTNIKSWRWWKHRQWRMAKKHLSKIKTAERIVGTVINRSICACSSWFADTKIAELTGTSRMEMELSKSDEKLLLNHIITW